MTKVNQNFECYEGNDVVLRVPITDRNTGEPKILTNATIVWKLSDSAKNSVVLSKSIGDGISIVSINGTDDGLEITITAEDTTSLLGTHYHECAVTDVAGDTHTVFLGSATIKQAVAT